MRYKNGAPKQVYVGVNQGDDHVEFVYTNKKRALTDAESYKVVWGYDIKIFTYVLKEKK